MYFFFQSNTKQKLGKKTFLVQRMFWQVLVRRPIINFQFNLLGKISILILKFYQRKFGSIKPKFNLIGLSLCHNIKLLPVNLKPTRQLPTFINLINSFRRSYSRLMVFPYTIEQRYYLAKLKIPRAYSY